MTVADAVFLTLQGCDMGTVVDGLVSRRDYAIGGEYFPDPENTFFVSFCNSKYRVAPREDRPGHSFNSRNVRDIFAFWICRAAVILKEETLEIHICHPAAWKIIQ
jgi:hypothetical protein